LHQGTQKCDFPDKKLDLQHIIPDKVLKRHQYHQHNFILAFNKKSIFSLVGIINRTIWSLVGMNTDILPLSEKVGITRLNILLDTKSFATTWMA